MQASYAISLVSENPCSSRQVCCSVAVTRRGMRMLFSSYNSVSKRFYFVSNSKGIDSSQSSLNRQRSCMIILASNVTGPKSPSGSKMREIRDNILRFVGASRGCRWLMDEYLNTSTRQFHAMSSVLFLSEDRINSFCSMEEYWSWRLGALDDHFLSLNFPSCSNFLLNG